MAIVSLKKLFLVAAAVIAVAVALPSGANAAPASFGFEGSSTLIGANGVLDFPVAIGTCRKDVISYPLVSYISMHFLDFDLPKGDFVAVRSPDSSVSHTYSEKGHDKRSNFVASFIPSTTAVVEYFAASASSESNHEAAGIGYTISDFSRGIYPKGYEAVCGGSDQSVPAKCFVNGTAVSPFDTLPLAYEKSKSVAWLLVNGTSLCTGWLVGSEGHLITNYRCIFDAGFAAVADFEFGAERASCSVQCKSVLGYQRLVMPTTSTFGTNSLANDYSLVKLPETVGLSDYKYLVRFQVQTSSRHRGT